MEEPDETWVCRICEQLVGYEESVACDGCNHWIHLACSGLTMPQFLNLGEARWFCKICRTAHMHPSVKVSQSSNNIVPGQLVWAQKANFQFWPAIAQFNGAGPHQDQACVTWVGNTIKQKDFLSKTQILDFVFNFRLIMDRSLLKVSPDYLLAVVLGIKIFWRAIEKPLPPGLTDKEVLTLFPEPGLRNGPVIVTDLYYMQQVFGLEHQSMVATKKKEETVHFPQFVCHPCGKHLSTEEDLKEHLVFLEKDNHHPKLVPVAKKRLQKARKSVAQDGNIFANIKKGLKKGGNVEDFPFEVKSARKTIRKGPSLKEQFLSKLKKSEETRSDQSPAAKSPSNTNTPKKLSHIPVITID